MPDPTERHPFIDWWAALKRFDAVSLEGKDFILTDLGGKRFALGVHQGVPLLCWLKEDDASLGSIHWTSAAFAYGLKDRDWVALSAADIRVKGSSVLNPVPARLFIPVTLGRLSPWKDSPSQKLALGVMSVKKGKPSFDGSPAKTIPLKLLGK